jgi:hypothetical protein
MQEPNGNNFYREDENMSYNRVEAHARICKNLTDMYERKNHDYGDAFAVTRQEHDNAILFRIFDKYNRLKTLKKGSVQRVPDESIKDTLMDLANYCIMELIEMEVDELGSK